MPMKKPAMFCFLIGVCVLLFTTEPCVSDSNSQSLWRSTINLDQIGKGDLDQTYRELLDYFFPRQLSSNMNNECYIVLRFLPSEGQQHQLNILFNDSKIGPVWAFELPKGLPLSDSLQAQTLARTIPVLSWHVDPSKKMKELVAQFTTQGIGFTLSPGLVLHGNENQLWADCGFTHFEASITTPPGTANESIAWANDLWSESQSQRPVK